MSSSVPPMFSTAIELSTSTFPKAPPGRTVAAQASGSAARSGVCRNSSRAHRTAVNRMPPQAVRPMRSVGAERIPFQPSDSSHAGSVKPISPSACSSRSATYEPGSPIQLLARVAEVARLLEGSVGEKETRLSNTPSAASARRKPSISRRRGLSTRSLIRIGFARAGRAA